jgi:hypothetical protein
MMLADMHCVPSYAVLSRWLAGYTEPGSTQMTLPYDDVLDVLKEYLRAAPVDENWYKAEYRAVADFLARSPAASASSHFLKQGYFEGRKPFARDWRGLTEPIAFSQVQSRLRIIPSHGRLNVEITHDEFCAIIKNIIVAVPVDQSWYRATYPDAAEAIDDEMFRSEAHHYAEVGYFEGCFPFEIAVDAEWYVSRYDHVRMGLQRGVVMSAQDHFTRVGYNEGCRPTPP